MFCSISDANGPPQ